MRPMPDALLATNEELFSLSTRVRELASTSINLDPNTRDRIIIRPSAKSYALKRKAAAAHIGENRDKLACFTSIASDALPVTPAPATSERVPQSRHAPSPQESARRIRCESRPENTPPSPMPRVGERASAVATAQKKRRVFEGRIDKRNMSPRFRPVMKPSLRQITLPVPQPSRIHSLPLPSSKPRPAQTSGACGCHEGFECPVCRIRKLTQSFSSIIATQCDKWTASSLPSNAQA
ncbi:hypothetical protein FA13DRAFT_1770588 [Coprinellus micaceus]|uniref:Uncharacterized protein n=1 Tax=Coprinellus micaceus TaxID=71717 RepID=A0A4Y7TVT6_COPMI|nr:hypothetical protein FA13DRAFT_1770588 [Coprinellus micaceus]